MTHEYSEDNLIEDTAMKLFQDQLGWQTMTAFNQEEFGESSVLGRENKKQVILKNIFLKKIKELNPDLPLQAYNHAYEKLIEDNITKSMSEMNLEKYKLLRDGILVDFINSKGEQVKNKSIRVFDFESPDSNEFIAVRQMWIQGKSNRERRPDIIGFVNGIPLLFIELKAAHRKLESAYNDNFTDYKDVIPQLFHFNAFVVLSNGLESRIGSVTGRYEHFHEWKRITEEDDGVVALDRIIVGVCEKNRFLDLFENYILFDNSTSSSIVKLIARNHQFIGVNKAIASIVHNESLFKLDKISLEDKQKLGVFWHTQGSGKSYSMVFFCQKIHRKFIGSYTFLIVTDRNELDNQIYGTFSSVGAVPQVKSSSNNSIRAGSGNHLKELLSSDHRYLFTLIHKFNFEEEITQRKDIIVISDEAHRTQGGNLALNLRKALPNASFIGFTGTPLFKDDEITKRIFGDYISRYDFKRSVLDGATVPLYYDNRGELLGLSNPNITAEMRSAIDSEAEDLDSDQKAKIEKQFAREYPILTAKSRLEAIAKDVVWHFFNRGYKGKAMFIAMDKLIAVKMYDFINHQLKIFIEEREIELRKGKDGDQEQLEKKRELEWMKETEISVVVSSEQNEIQKFKNWDLDIEPHRLKMNEQNLEERFKNENDPFRLVIVCAMWITGFDVPSLSTLYIDKPLKSHTLMQAIARANRIHKGKNNGMIVDYIETYTSLLEALAIYGEGGAANKDKKKIKDDDKNPLEVKDKLKAELEDALQSVEKFFIDDVAFNLNTLIHASGLNKISALETAINAVYTNDNTKMKFQILAREVFKKFKALQPDRLLHDYRARRDAINTIYTSIEDNIKSANIDDLMKKIQEVVDRSINVSLKASSPKLKSSPIDLSGLNFELIEKYFLKTKNKNTLVQNLKDTIDEKLQSMVKMNPTTVDFYKTYSSIIDNYNSRKDSAMIEETFRKLMELLGELSEKELEAKREGLSDEQKAVFDILRSGKELNNKEKKEVKKLAVDLLEELKNDKLKVEYWSQKATTSASVTKFIQEKLFQFLPSPAFQDNDIEIKTNEIFEHLKNQYFGGGVSAYGNY